MQSSGKRSIQINVKLNGSDYDLLRRAADRLWPDAVISNSGLVLGLAKLAAKNILTERKSKAAKKP
jgi:uncharacterized protein (DUF1778 family)